MLRLCYCYLCDPTPQPFPSKVHLDKHCLSQTLARPSSCVEYINPIIILLTLPRSQIKFYPCLQNRATLFGFSRHSRFPVHARVIVTKQYEKKKQGIKRVQISYHIEKQELGTNMHVYMYQE